MIAAAAFAILLPVAARRGSRVFVAAAAATVAAAVAVGVAAIAPVMAVCGGLVLASVMARPTRVQSPQLFPGI